MDNKNELLWEQFAIESKILNNARCYFLVSQNTGKVVQCHPETGVACTVNQNRLEWEALQIVPVENADPLKSDAVHSILNRRVTITGHLNQPLCNFGN